MPTPAYRITFSMTVVVYQDSHERIRTLGPGVILIPASCVDRAGMIEATCNGNRVRVFERDLKERSERIEVETATR